MTHPVASLQTIINMGERKRVSVGTKIGVENQAGLHLCKISEAVCKVQNRRKSLSVMGRRRR